MPHCYGTSESRKHLSPVSKRFSCCRRADDNVSNRKGFGICRWIGTDLSNRKPQLNSLLGLQIQILQIIHNLFTINLNLIKKTWLFFFFFLINYLQSVRWNAEYYGLIEYRTLLASLWRCFFLVHLLTLLEKIYFDEQVTRKRGIRAAQISRFYDDESKPLGGGKIAEGEHKFPEMWNG